MTVKIPEYEKRTIHEFAGNLTSFIAKFEMFTDKQIDYVMADLHEFYETERATQAAVGQFLAQLKAFRYEV
jgi:hypothetical protein